MEHIIRYCGGTDIGKRRSVNQDNLSMEGKFLRKGTEHEIFGVSETAVKAPLLLGIFDGMGGEQCGEDAAFIAAEKASKTPPEQLGSCAKIRGLFLRSNDDICRFAAENELQSVGTTAAVMVFSAEEILIGCIGDSKIFLAERRGLRQLSTDDSFSMPLGGRKPLLTQCLGIPPEEMMIQPHIGSLPYRAAQRFLICSDGLTDMVPTSEIHRILRRNPIEQTAEKLIERALMYGGDDNITVIVCEVCR